MNDRNEAETLERLLSHEQWLRQLALHLARDPSEAEDLVQGTWLAALRSGPVEHSRAWLSQVIKNLASRGWREKRQLFDERQHPGLDGEGRTSDSGLESIARTDVHRNLAEAVMDLDVQERTVLVEHYFQERTLADIARGSGVPEGTVRWRKMQALASLRERLDQRSRGDRTAWLSALLLLQDQPQKAVATGSRIGTVWAAAAATLLLVSGAVLFRGMTAEPSRSDQSQESTPVDSAITGLRALDVLGTGEEVAAAEEVPEAPATPQSVEGEGQLVSDPREITITAVTDAGVPIEGATVWIVTKDGMLERGRTDRAGQRQVTYTSAHLTGAGYSDAVGALTIRITAPNATTSLAHHLKGKYLRPGAVAPPMMLGPGGATLGGSLQDSDGAPLSRVLFYLRVGRDVRTRVESEDHWMRGGQQLVRTDEHGQFEVSGFSSGPWTLLVAVEGRLLHEQSVELVDGVRTEVSIELETGATCVGRAIDEGGRPVPFAKVWYDAQSTQTPTEYQNVLGYDRRRMWTLGAVEADAGGAFELSGILPGPTRIWAQDPSRPNYVAERVLTVDEGGRTLWDPVLKPRDPLIIDLSREDGAPLTDERALLSAGTEPPYWVRLETPDARGRVKAFDYPQGALFTLYAANASLRVEMQRLGAEFPATIEPRKAVIPVVRKRQLRGTIDSVGSVGGPSAMILALGSKGSAVNVIRPRPEDGEFVAELAEDVYHLELHVPSIGVQTLGRVDLTAGDVVGWDHMMVGTGRLVPDPNGSSNPRPESDPTPPTSSGTVRFEILGQSRITELSSLIQPIVEGTAPLRAPVALLAGTYLVKWFKEDTLIGERELQIQSGQDVPWPTLRLDQGAHR